MMLYRNTWGSPESGVDQQRSDLFRVMVELPRFLGSPFDGANVWSSHIGWAVEKFPFPAREKESIPIKYLQQTNHQIGGDTATEAVDMTVRYAFNQRTAEILERWHWAVANPKNGGVALSSAIKTIGYFFWLVPNVEILGRTDAASESQAYNAVKAYKLVGCWPKDLKPSDADMTQGNGFVTLSLKMQIDRYYPEDPGDLVHRIPGLQSVLAP